MPPKLQVSVIIPTFNRDDLLPRAIQSVLKEKEIPLELIIVDDGSTDETERLVSSLEAQDKRLRFIRLSERQGPSKARNVGIAKSTAPFIAFLDSDDEWLSGKLKAQLDFFSASPSAMICQTEEIWMRNGKRVNPMKKHKKFGGWIFEQCLPLTIVSPSAVMMRRNFFDEVGAFDESLPACEDYDLWLRASARMPIGLIEKPYLVKCGGHPDQRSREFPAMDRFRIYALTKILNSGVLSLEQERAARAELRRKCDIVSRGARKRGRSAEADYYESLGRESSAKKLKPPFPSPICKEVCDIFSEEFPNK